MSVDTNRAVVRRYYDEVLNARRVDVIDQLATHDYVENNPFPGQGDGKADLARRASLLLEAFSPMHFTIEDLIADGDRVVVRWTNRGTHSGSFMGIPATGRPFEVAGIDIHRVSEGRMAEHWHVVDQFSQLQQLGLLPAPAEAS